MIVLLLPRFMRHDRKAGQCERSRRVEPGFVLFRMLVEKFAACIEVLPIIFGQGHFLGA